jgi:ribosomal protein S12 methylthiotransferase accessory factor YcaO
MSAKTTPDPKEVLERLHWVKAGHPESFAVPTDWQAAAVELYDALDATIERLEAAGLCRRCGRPLGSYCVQCAWPSRRRRERQTDA